MIALFVAWVLAISYQQGVVAVVQVLPRGVADFPEPHGGGDRKADDLVDGDNLEVVFSEVPDQGLYLAKCRPPIAFVALANKTQAGEGDTTKFHRVR